MERTEWPKGMEPTACPVALRTERVIDAPPERVWSWLSRADLWSDWFAGAHQVRWSGGPDLAVGTTLRWRMSGNAAHAVVHRCRPNELLEWEGGGLGVRAYHAWRLEPVGDK